MPKPVSTHNARRPTTQPPGDYRPAASVDAADVLARVYALILSWPTTQEKQERQEGSNPT